MASSEHETKNVASVRCAVITISDTRTRETDTSGPLIRERLESAGYAVIRHEILPDDPGIVRKLITELCDDPACHAILLTGGTGLAPRDTTYEAIAALLDKRLDGFGELFRMLSYNEIGAPAMLSRATAGVCGSTLIFSMPGSTGAVRLAMEKLILPELGHLTALVNQTAGETQA